MSDMLLNSAVSSLIPTSFGHQPTTAAQHFVGMPLQPPPSGYSLWARATAGGCAADMSPRQQGAGTSLVSAVLSLSSCEAPPVTVAAVPATVGKYMGASPTPSQEDAVMSSKYLKAAQELLDEAVSVSKGVEEASAAAAVAKSAMAVKKKEDSEGGSGGGAGDGGGSKGGGPAEMSTAERQELQMKKSKLANMLDEVEQRYRQYRHQVQVVASSFEAVAGAGSARTYTALAMRTISRQFRCLRDAIAAQVRSASRALGEDAEAAAGGRTVGSRLRFIDHQLRQQRALQKLGTMQGGAWRPQRGLPERSVSILRAWLFEHFLHPYPKDSDRIMLSKQTGLTRSQVSNWFINARVRLWKPMVEEMYLEETKDKDANAAACAGVDSSGGGSKMSNNSDGTEPPKHVDNGMSSSAGTTSKAARLAGNIGGSKVDGHASILEFAGDQQAQASFYGGDGGGGASFQHRLKKARTDEPAAFHASGVATLLAQAAATARHDEAVSHRELLMKFMEAGGGTATATAGERGQQEDDDVGGYSLFTPAPYVQFGSEQYAFAGNSGGVSLTLGLPHGAAAAEHTTPFLTSNSNASDVTAGYDMNMQSTKSFAAQLMRDFVA